MLIVGEMVRAGSSAPMKIVDISADVAECIWIDGNGFIRRRFHTLSELLPMWLSLGPKSIWPEGGHLDEIEELKEQQYAAARLAERKRLARKARKSQKIKRQVLP